MREEVKVYGFPVVATVKKILGTCRLGHKVGDKVIFEEMEIIGKLCNGALATMVPTVQALMREGAEFPWSKDRDVTTVPCAECSNCDNLVFFELKRDRKHPWPIPPEYGK
jgi:uncharacterized repeat protein (TIGR04076 family)